MSATANGDSWRLLGALWVFVLSVAWPIPATATPIFRDVTVEAKLDFQHFNGMSGSRYLLEVMGSGAALLDYDNDGDLDVYLVQGAMLEPDKSSADAVVEPRQAIPRDLLFRNDSTLDRHGQQVLRFTDVTFASGLDARGYGMGVATGDFNNDGWMDLYLSNFGANQLWLSNGTDAAGRVTFADATSTWSAWDSRWSVATTVFDYDADGWLDLYLGNYLKFELARRQDCKTATGSRDYCHPSSYPPDVDVLFHNLAGQRFADVSNRALPDRGAWNTLGAVAADFDGDGWIDLYVANDEQPNQLWINRRDGTFADEALLGGCGVNGKGQPEASMGVAAIDIDADGDEDLFMTHLARQTHTLFINDGKGLFRDLSHSYGLEVASWPYTGFGTALLDYDNDGRLDIAVANGTVSVIEELESRGDPFPFHQPNQLFRNRGDGSFEEVTEAAGEAFLRSEVSRGMAAGDIDNDGDTDLLVTNNNGPARLLLNQVGHRRSWLGVRLVGEGIPRDMLGARVALHRSGKPTLWRRVGTDGSYASANDPRILFGLGDHTGPVRIEVRWPDRRVEIWDDVPTGDYLTLRQGSGKAVPDAAAASTPPSSDTSSPESSDTPADTSSSDTSSDTTAADDGDQ